MAWQFLLPYLSSLARFFSSFHAAAHFGQLQALCCGLVPFPFSPTPKLPLIDTRVCRSRSTNCKPSANITEPFLFPASYRSLLHLASLKPRIIPYALHRHASSRHAVHFGYTLLSVLHLCALRRRAFNSAPHSPRPTCASHLNDPLPLGF